MYRALPEMPDVFPRIRIEWLGRQRDCVSMPWPSCIRREEEFGNPMSRRIIWIPNALIKLRGTENGISLSIDAAAVSKKWSVTSFQLITIRNWNENPQQRAMTRRERWNGDRCQTRETRDFPLAEGTSIRQIRKPPVYDCFVSSKRQLYLDIVNRIES